MGKRIHIEKTGGKVKVTIKGNLESWMKQALLSWIIVWLSLGVYVIYYMLNAGLDKEGNIFFLTYLLFWAWFAYKAVYAYLFKVYGFEWISLSADELLYGRSLPFVTSTLFRSSIDAVKVERIDEHERSFSFVYGQSFWVVGNEKLKFSNKEKHKSFGMHLTPSEANELLGTLNKRIKHLKKS
jgi:hypothetical protein